MNIQVSEGSGEILKYEDLKRGEIFVITRFWDTYPEQVLRMVIENGKAICLNTGFLSTPSPSERVYRVEGTFTGKVIR